MQTYPNRVTTPLLPGASAAEQSDDGYDDHDWEDDWYVSVPSGMAASDPGSDVMLQLDGAPPGLGTGSPSALPASQVMHIMGSATKSVVYNTATAGSGSDGVVRRVQPQRECKLGFVEAWLDGTLGNPGSGPQSDLPKPARRKYVKRLPSHRGIFGGAGIPPGRQGQQSALSRFAEKVDTASSGAKGRQGDVRPTQTPARHGVTDQDVVEVSREDVLEAMKDVKVGLKNRRRSNHVLQAALSAPAIKQEPADA